MTQTAATAKRVKLTPKEVSKEAKGKLEKDDNPGAGHRDISSIHPKHWDALAKKEKDEKTLLEKLGITDKRVKKVTKLLGFW